jgi:hypothetical protein
MRATAVGGFFYLSGHRKFLIITFASRRLSENRKPTAEKQFWPIVSIKSVKYNKYSPHLIETMDSKPLSLATASILGQPPGSLYTGVQRVRTLNYTNSGYKNKWNLLIELSNQWGKERV